MINSSICKYIYIIFIILLLVSCKTIKHNNSFEWSEIETIEESDYIGGFSNYHLSIARRAINDFHSNSPNRCENHSETINFIDRELPKPQIQAFKYDHLNKLNLLIQNENQIIRDLSLYITAQLGPSASELLPWLKYYQSNDYYFSNWLHPAIESISCGRWKFTTFNQSYNKKLLEFEFVNKLDRMVSENLLFPPMEIHNFVFDYINDIDKPINPKILLKHLNSSKLKKTIKAEIISALSVQDIKLLNINLDKFKLHINDKNFGDSIKFLFIDSLNPFGLEIIQQQLKEGNFNNLESICNYGPKAERLEKVLLSHLRNSKEKSNIQFIIKALGCMKSLKSIALILTHLDNQDWEFQIYVIEALNRINPINPKVKIALNELMENTWSDFVKYYIKKRYVHKNRKCEDDELCYDTSPLSMDLITGAKDHGMMDCTNLSQFSYDKKHWFHVNWLGSENSILPEGFPSIWKSKYYDHSLLKVENGWIFGSDYGHNDGYLTFWSGKSSSSYIIKVWTDVFKVLYFDNEVYALGYSILDNNFSGHLYKLTQNTLGVWNAKVALYLPGHPSKYGYGPQGELLIADSLNQYSVKNNKITPLFCKE